MYHVFNLENEGVTRRKLVKIQSTNSTSRDLRLRLYFDPCVPRTIPSCDTLLFVLHPKQVPFNPTPHWVFTEVDRDPPEESINHNKDSTCLYLSGRILVNLGSDPHPVGSLPT